MKFNWPWRKKKSPTVEPIPAAPIVKVQPYWPAGPLHVQFPEVPAELTYLSGLRDRARTDDADHPTHRADNLLDGLIGGALGLSGGGWSNPVTGVGTFARDKVMQARYDEPYRISDPELSALYNGNDIAKRIITCKPKEIFRRGWQLVIAETDEEASENGPEEYDNPLEEQPLGGESGPAAPGTPLVNPSASGTPGVSTPTRMAQGPKNSSATAPSNTATAGPAPGAERAVTDPSTVKPAPTQDPYVKKPPSKPAKGSDPKAPSDQGAGAAMAAAVCKYADRLGIKQRFFEAMVFGRLYGGGLMLLGIDDGQPMDQPLDPERPIRSIKYVAWIDRRFVFAADWVTEVGPNFGEVALWEIINPFGGQSNTRVHASRCIRFDGEPVDFLMRRRLLGWTLSVLQAPYDVMRQFDQSFQGIANLMADMSQAVMKLQGLAQMISADPKTLNTRMRMVDMARSTTRMLYLDAEHEDFERKPTPLTGVADTLEMQMLRLASAAEMPVALLFGRERSGLNATGDADFRRWYDVCMGEAKTYVEPRLLQLYRLICMAQDGPTGGKCPEMSLTWHKMYEPSEKEQAEIRWLMAQADEKYVVNQIVMPEEIATSRFRDGELHLDTEIDLKLRQEKQETLELPPSGAEKAQQEQDNKAADRQMQSDALKAKAADGGPPAGKAGASSNPRLSGQTQGT